MRTVIYQGQRKSMYKAFSLCQLTHCIRLVFSQCTNRLRDFLLPVILAYRYYSLYGQQEMIFDQVKILLSHKLQEYR